MIKIIDLTPYKIRVIADKHSFDSICPLNMLGTVLELCIGNHDYTDFIHDKPEEAIIHVIFSASPAVHINMSVKVRWDNNTTNTVQQGKLKLVSSNIPMSASIWGDTPDLLLAPKDYDIASENRELNLRRNREEIKSFSSVLSSLSFNSLNSDRFKLKAPTRKKAPKLREFDLVNLETLLIDNTEDRVAKENFGSLSRQYIKNLEDIVVNIPHSGSYSRETTYFSDSLWVDAAGKPVSITNDRVVNTTPSGSGNFEPIKCW